MAGLGRQLEEALARGVRNGLKEAGMAILNEATRIIESEDLIDRGSLLKENGFQFRKEEDFQGEVYFLPVHAPHVELGTRPHWPPLEPLIGWVRRNMRIAPESGEEIKRPISTDVFRKPRKSEVEKIAKRIQARIAAVGSPPHRFLTRAAASQARKIPSFIHAAVTREYQKLGRTK